MGTIDRDTYASFEERRSALKLAVEIAMKHHDDPAIRAGWNESLLNVTKETLLDGASIALGAVDLEELQRYARLFAERQKPSPAIQKSRARDGLIAHYKAELVELSERLPIVDDVSALLGEDPLTPSRREVGGAIAKFALVSSRIETERLNPDRLEALRGLTVQAIDTILTNSRPDWIHATEPPQAAPRRPRSDRERPAAGATAIPTQPTRERPSLLRPPGSGFRF